MRKGVILTGAFLIALLMISTVTAVPTSHSKPVMDMIDKVERQQTELESLFDQLPTGIFDLLWQLLVALFNLIVQIIGIVNTILGIFQLIQGLLNGLQTLLQMIQDFIALINELLNPDGLAI